MNSLIATIRAAVRPGSVPHAFVDDDDPGAEASLSETPQVEASSTGANMSDPQVTTGAATAAVASLATTVAAAAAGGDNGFQAAAVRMNAILGADGIKGDAGRMSAALDLSVASPDMAADAVVAFVTANVPANGASASSSTSALAAATTTAAASYEASRVAAANLAMPGAGAASQKAGATINRDAIFASRRVNPKGA